MTHTNECLYCGLELNLVVEIKNSCAQSPTEFHEIKCPVVNGNILAYTGTRRFGSLSRKEEE